LKRKEANMEVLKCGNWIARLFGISACSCPQRIALR
jgi:hypothetical protein